MVSVTGKYDYALGNAYSNDSRIRDSLPVYFSKYHFINGGYDQKWFRIKFGPVFFPLPNIKDRVAAVKIHDIHHLLTEYPATLRGEAEIGAWEIASGCGKYYVAWILNTGAFFYGMFVFPKALFKAFMCGRRCTTNLYHNIAYDDVLLDRTVGELRTYTGIRNRVKNTLPDLLYFILWCSIAACFELLFVYLLCLLYRASYAMLH